MTVRERLRRTALGYAWSTRCLKGVISELGWQFRRHLRQRQTKRHGRTLAYLSKHGMWPMISLETRERLIREMKGQPQDNALVSVLCLSKKNGNRDHDLPRMLESMGPLGYATEVLVKTGTDDDIAHYWRVWRTCGALNERGQNVCGRRLRIIAGDEYGGRRNFHRFYESIALHRSRNCQLVITATDDGVLQPGWLDHALDLVKSRPDGMYIGGELPFERVIERTLQTLTSPGVYAYEANNYWFLGSKLLDKLTAAVSDAEEADGWTAFGESMVVDSWFSALVATAWEDFGQNIYVQLPRLAERRGVVAWHRNPDTRTVRQAALESLMSERSRRMRQALLSRAFGWDGAMPEQRLDAWEKRAVYG